MTIGQTSALMSRAFSLLLTVRDFQIGTSSPSLCLAIASRDLTSSSHDASELNTAPRYLNYEYRVECIYTSWLFSAKNTQNKAEDDEVV